MSLSKRQAMEGYVGRCTIKAYNGYICKPCVAFVQGHALENHYDRNHALKDGYHFCHLCYKSVCQVQQLQQIEQHERTDKHRACLEACKSPVKYCATCGAVKPLDDHNRTHQIRHYKLVDEPHNVDLCKSSKTDRIVAQLARSLARSDAGGLKIGSYCNEHFEQTFGCDYTNFPIGIAKHKVARCGTCNNLQRVFGCAIKVRQGNLFTIDEAEFRRHIVRDLDFDVPRARENRTISPAEFGNLSPAEKVKWVFNAETFNFELAVGATEEKKTDFVKAFLAGENLPGDSTDGAVVPEGVIDWASEEPQEEEFTDESVLD